MARRKLPAWILMRYRPLKSLCLGATDKPRPPAPQPRKVEVSK